MLICGTTSPLSYPDDAGATKIPHEACNRRDPRRQTQTQPLDRYFAERMSDLVAALCPQRPPVPDTDELTRYLRLAIKVQKRGMAMEKRPFGAILVGLDVQIYQK